MFKIYPIIILFQNSLAAGYLFFILKRYYLFCSLISFITLAHIKCNIVILQPPKAFDVIYADPPWQYNSKSGRDFKHGAAMKYQVLSNSDIERMVIPSAKNSVCFLWVTIPLLPEGLQVLKAWGYQYKTTITWRKIMSMGMGWWWRGQVELLLFGVKGKVKAFRMQECNFIQAKAGKHSEKPVEFRQLIERATTHMPNKLELFARQKVEGWHAWGNEIDSDIDIKQYGILNLKNSL